MPDKITKCVIIFQIVGMLNMMFGLFDVMTEKNGIYKVRLVLSIVSMSPPCGENPRNSFASLSRWRPSRTASWA